MGTLNLHNRPYYWDSFQFLFRLLGICGISLLLATTLLAQDTCDNVTDGGMIVGNETGCANPTFDPSLIISIQAPTGGSGDIEYLWMKTTGDPTAPFSAWDIIPGANDESYDPLPIMETTHYARCSRRMMCTDYVGETNVITKTINCCSFDIGIQLLTDDVCARSVQLSAIAPNGSQYFWSANAGTFSDPTDANPTFSVTDNGNYVISLRVIGPDSCEMSTARSLMLGGFMATIAADNPTCDEQDGAVSVDITGGTPPFQYDWGDAFPNTPTLSNLSAGIYIVIITDANGCTMTLTEELVGGSSLEVNFQTSNVTCNGDSDGSINIFVTNAVEPITYTWANNVSTGPNANNLTAGPYSVTVSDASGCTGVANVTILEPAPLVATIAMNSDCGAAFGEAVANISGGTPTYSYVWDDAAQQTTQTAIDLANGTYTVTVTDNAGCTTTATITVSNGGLEVMTNTTPAGCTGEATGTASVSVNNGIPPFTYNWSSGGNEAILTNLTPNLYTVTVTDANGCSNTADAIVGTEMPFSIVMTSEDATCEESNGQATANIVGSNGNYTFIWDDPNNQTGDTAEGLAPGNYTVTATDANGCTAQGSIVIGVAGGGLSPTIQVSSQKICLGERIELSAQVTGDVVSYSWIATEGIFENAANPITNYVSNIGGSQTISLTVTDEQGCLSSTSITIDVIEILEGQIGADITGICLDDAFQDTVTVLAISGTDAASAFIVSDESDNIISIQTSNVFDFESSDAGTNSIRLIHYDPDLTSGLLPGENVNDITGCFAFSNAIQINKYSGADCDLLCTTNGGNISTTDVTTICSGDGLPDIIDVAVTGQSGEYTRWAVTDIHQTVLALPDPPPFDFEGAVAGICYIWHISSDRPLDDLVVGSSLTDLPGCGVLSSNSIEIVKNAPRAFDILPARQDVCENSPIRLLTNWEGSFISFNWSSDGGSFDDPSAESPIFTPDRPGTATINVTVFDGLCNATATANISTQGGLEVLLDTENARCLGDENGRITLNPTGGTAPYNFNWSNDLAPTSTQTGLSAGVYEVTVTDAGDCSTALAIPIAYETNISLDVTVQGLSCYGDNTGAITTIATGGTAPYEYIWNGQMVEETIDSLFAGTYFINVTDATNCEAFAEVTLAEPPLLTAEIMTTPASCLVLGTATAIATGGTPPYAYQWNDASSSTTPQLIGVPAGTYQATITDANGCVVFVEGEVSPLSVTNCAINIVRPISDIDGSDGILEVQTVGGNNLTYLWNTGSTSNRIENLSLGLYSVTVTDNLGCTCTDELFLGNPARIGDFVFEDKNGNGLQDAGEEGLRGVVIQLNGTTDGGGMVELRTTTDEDGLYFFSVSAGIYTITVIDNLNLPAAPPNAGDDDLDSDIDPITLMTEPIVILEGQYIDNIDIGLIPKGFCDNVLTGGSIAEDEELCSTNADPALIHSVSSPTGGSGEIEYLWLQSHKPDYTPGDPDWIEIPNSNHPSYDPAPIQRTTYYIRCARRKGCDNYPGETNVVGKVLIECATMPTAEALRVHPTDNQVVLEWTGNITMDNTHFVVEHSQDAIHYRTIGTTSAFLSESFTQYSYTDESPNMGENYYRIKTVHPTLGHHYSNAAMAMVKPEPNARITVYPNPVEEQLTIHFLENREEAAILEIANSFGQVLRQVAIDATIKQYQLSLDNLPSGIYYLKFQNRDLKRYGQKIVKLE